METVSINGQLRVIEYRNVKEGDLVYDKNNKTTYTATIVDADEAKWVVVN